MLYVLSSGINLDFYNTDFCICKDAVRTEITIVRRLRGLDVIPVFTKLNAKRAQLHEVTSVAKHFYVKQRNADSI